MLSFVSVVRTFSAEPRAIHLYRFVKSGYNASLAAWLACEKSRKPGQARKGAAVADSFCDTLSGRRFLLEISELFCDDRLATN